MASDGDGFNDVGVIQRIVPRLDPADISGTTLAVGIVNYHTSQVAQHHNPIDDMKTNRTYPGDERGASSERTAATTLAAACNADPVIDLR